MIVQFIFILNIGKDPNKSSEINNKLYIENNYENDIQTDCSTQIRYCTNNFDCSYFCKPSASFNIKNICDSTTKVCLPIAIENTTECEAKKGFLDSYVQTEIDGFWKCLNTKPYFFDDQQNLYEFVCANGGKSFYDFSSNIPLSCNCAAGFIKVFNINKPNIPICVQKEKLKILSSFIEMQ